MVTIVLDNLNCEQYVYLPKLAEQAEYYEEMVQFMQKLVLSSTSAAELTVEERNLLFVMYKKIIDSLCAAWRIVSSIEKKEEGPKNEEHVVLVEEYRSKIKYELSDACTSILTLLESNLIPSAMASCSGYSATDLAPTHPIMLGLTLNFSMFYYEILNQSDKACSMAKQAFEDAIVEIYTLGEESYKDNTLIMQLLRLCLVGCNFKLRTDNDYGGITAETL
ncbi:hypothetical protein PTKIN_Ptkin05aG0138900 [Pterospermum kingtungense]